MWSEKEYWTLGQNVNKHNQTFKVRDLKAWRRIMPFIWVYYLSLKNINLKNRSFLVTLSAFPHSTVSIQATLWMDLVLLKNHLTTTWKKWVTLKHKPLESGFCYQGGSNYMTINLCAHFQSFVLIFKKWKMSRWIQESSLD